MCLSLQKYFIRVLLTSRISYTKYVTRKIAATNIWPASVPSQVHNGKYLYTIRSILMRTSSQITLSQGKRDNSWNYIKQFYVLVRKTI